MKALKKMLAVVVSVVMALGMMTTAFAAESCTITAPDNSHTYAVYQIFTGDLSDGKLSNVKWGKNGTGTEGEAVSEATLTAVAAITGTEAEMAAAVATYVNLNSTAVGTVTNGSSISVPAGYYLIKDNGPAADGEGYSLYVVEIVDSVTISPKSGTTSSQKKVDDKNDSNTSEDAINWQDSADYDIGDDVPFQLKAIVASDYANYKNGYKLTFHDEESAGLTFDKDSVKVYVGETSTTPIDATNYTVVTEGLTDGCTFEVRFANLKDVAGVSAGSVIRVEYTSKLNTDAKIGDQGNPNTSHITYTNNPNDEQAGENGKTPDDTVIVFTYKVVVNKVDEKGDALVGASFELFKKEGNDWVSKGEIDGTNASAFTWTGLDDGDYKLSETQTPAGYNTISDIEFTVTAGHVDGDSPYLDSLSGGNLFTGEVSTGALTANIENKAGSTLPETGGMGTTLLYTIGGLMVIGAGILLITKKRMNA